ncbi:unnamed protein product [Effrenium voratum]|nr:unnamed protein product [Effrenium voratum]
MPPSNFALLGLKDAFHMLLKGFRVLLIVQPRFFPHFREVQLGLAACGLPDGLVEVLPGITPEADPEVLHAALKQVDRLQFTGSSAMFRSLVVKAIELGNLRMEHAGEVSGLNKVRLDGVSVTHPAVAQGTCWAAMANNGELCTSASLVEFDPAVGDTPEKVKDALLEAEKTFKLGRDPAEQLDVLLRDGKAEQLEVKTEEPADGFREWWEKTVLATPRDGPLQLSTNQSLGHCIYAPSMERAVEGATAEASNLYFVGVPEDPSAASARAGTTGAKLPESVFGGMKTYTHAVAGDHDGVGTVQTIFDNTKRRGASWRDQEDAYAQYELSEVAEMLLEFLSPRDQQTFSQQISNVLEVFSGFMPEATVPYPGQSLVNSEGRSQLVTLQALRPTRKSFLIPQGVGLPEDIVRMAALSAMSPLREVPADLHLLGAAQVGKLRVTDPLKSFIKVVEKQLKWRVHYHADAEQMVAALQHSEYPPYFFCVKDRRHLPIEVVKAVAEKGGYLYEGLPSDAFSLFRCMTASQAWTVACTEAEVQQAEELLLKKWHKIGLREEPLEAPEVVKPKRREMDIGGGFGDTGLAQDDSKWHELSDDEESDEEEMPLRLRSKPWPKWARLALAPALKARQANGSKNDLELGDREETGMRRQLLLEAQHTAPSASEEVPLTSPRDEEMEGAAADAGSQAEEEEEDAPTSFQQLMQWSAADRKANNFVPISGNLYRFWGLGIMDKFWSVQNFGLLAIFVVQLLSPPACIINNLFRMDWESWHFGVEDWYYIPGSRTNGISNLSKHVVATLFLIMFTLNGAMVIDKERIASMKISAMLDQLKKTEPIFLTHVNWFWLHVGRVMNCLVVLECCVIVYFAFVLSDTPMDVLFNSMAVTFLYNLDDIDGEMGFLTDDDWDGEELGKQYYATVETMMDEMREAGELANPDSVDPDSINMVPQLKSKYSHWTYRIAEPLVFFLAGLLPLMYIFIDNLQCKPSHTQEDLTLLTVEVRELQAKLSALSG